PPRNQPAPALVTPAAGPGTSLTPAGHHAASEPHRGNDADGLVRRAGCPPRRYRVAALGPAAQVRTGPPCNTTSPPVPQAAAIVSVAGCPLMQPGGSLAPGRPASTGGGDHRDHYAVAFGGLLLLGGRAGDLLGRRRIFIAGLLVFSLASLLGGLATDQAWLIAARAVQGAGAAMAAPTALSLIAVTFPPGRARTRATAVYSAMAIVGIVAGLIAG